MKHNSNQFLRKIRKGGMPYIVPKSDVITSNSILNNYLVSFYGSIFLLLSLFLNHKLKT